MALGLGIGAMMIEAREGRPDDKGPAAERVLHDGSRRRVMRFIDWSDPIEVLGLLAELVADEAATPHGDPEREQLMRELARALGVLVVRERASDQIGSRLERIIGSQPEDFTRDLAIAYLEGCVEELRRLERGQQEFIH